ncbi:Uncharacterised protein [Streptococcus pneumoniae]|nr:Uncharacterised protein [Streptococcus pneumoniae]
MTQAILEIKHLKTLEVGNQPSYAPLTYLKRQLMDKSFIMDKTSSKKAMTSRNTVKS